MYFDTVHFTFLMLMFYSDNTLRKNQQHSDTASSSVDSERQSELDNAGNKSQKVSVESQRLSKLASAFEESLRISRDSDKNEKSATGSVVDFERPNKPVDASKKSLDLSVMERCLAAMTRSNSRPSGEPEEQEGLASRHGAGGGDDDDDDDDCSSLLASLSDLETQLQSEIRQSQQRLDPTSGQPKTGVENTSHNSRTSVEANHDPVESRLEEPTDSYVPDSYVPGNHASTTTTTSTTITTTTTGCS